MNKDLEHLIKTYAIKSHSEVNNELISKSKDNLISMLLDLLTTYINDKNSSTLREFLTVSISGYEHSEAKIGYNGYRQLSAGKSINCEAKPKNFDTTELEKFNNKKKRTKPSSLNAGGSFNDYTWARFNKDKQDNLNMLVSGFVDGRLIYILEFPFNHSSFVKKLEGQLKKRLPNGDEVNQYVRGANFSYKDIIDCNDLKINFLLSKLELSNYSGYITKLFFEFLEKNAD